MNARTAQSDTEEIVRLAADMFASFGHNGPSADWHEAAREAVQRRLDEDLVVFVVDDPTQPRRLAALLPAWSSTGSPPQHNLSTKTSPAARLGRDTST